MTFRRVCDWKGDWLPWLKNLRGQSGAYVIRTDILHRVLYVGESHTGSLRKTIQRHFQTWNDDPARKHHTYDRQDIEVAVKKAAGKAAVTLQDVLIRRLNPRDNLYEPEPF